MRAILSFHADRWLIRPNGGAPPAFFEISDPAGAVAEGAHIQLCARIASTGARLPRLAARTGTIQVKVRWRGVDIAGWLFDQFPFLASLAANELLLGLVLLSLTAMLVGLGVPGVVTPLSFSSAALLGSWLGMAVVIAGALLGSTGFFLATRRWLREHVRTRWGDRLQRFDGEIARRGVLYAAGLRIAGVPHFLINAASALSPMQVRSFAVASLLGFLPAVVLASLAGSAI